MNNLLKFSEENVENFEQILKVMRSVYPRKFEIEFNTIIRNFWENFKWILRKLCENFDKIFCKFLRYFNSGENFAQILENVTEGAWHAEISAR